MRLFIFYLFIFSYLELIFKILVSNTFGIYLLLNLLYIIFLSALLSILTKSLPTRIQKFVFLIIVFLISLWFCIETIFYKTFGVYFSLSATGFADQALGFFAQAISIIKSNFLIIVLMFIPFFLAIIFYKRIKFANDAKLILLTIAICSYLCFYNSLINNGTNSLKSLYLYTQNNALNHQYFGVIPSTIIEMRKNVTSFKEEIVIVNPEKDIDGDEEEIKKFEYEKQILDIDFNSLIENEKNHDIKTMHEYFANNKAGNKNEYTGFFKDKNLILFMAESFNGVVVDRELTPTLYKLVNNGFVFDNFYSPVILSTIGGEFQELTGLYPDLSMLSYVWRTGKNSYPFGLATLFKENGYSAYSYHNHDYSFQERNIYLNSIGFDYYEACGNGLEEKIDCSIFPKSDQEMIDSTIDEYINDDKFLVYYATVSGHMNYDFTDNAMSIKHQEEVKDLPYSYRVKAYIATQIELDRALESLLSKLEENGQLENTVIALVGDHYPYALSLDEMNEMSDTQKDGIIEINRSNFILYNSEMETKHINNVGSQIDVLPTIYNLFDIAYDSRLIIGKDILDNSTLKLAIFNDRSWVSNLGKYYASTNTFEPFISGLDVGDSYVDAINQNVANMINMSKNIMYYDYYRFFDND